MSTPVVNIFLFSITEEEENKLQWMFLVQPCSIFGITISDGEKRFLKLKPKVNEIFFIITYEEAK